MNNKVIFGLVGSFLAGAFAGIGGTYLYMKKVYCDKKIDEGIADYILHRYDGSEEIVKEAVSDDEELDDGDIPVNADIVPKYQTPVNERVDYGSFYEKKSPQEILAEREHPVDSDEDDEHNDILENMSEEDQENYQQGLDASLEHEAYVRGEIDANEIIPESEWDNNPTFEGVTLFYWLGDDILTDELEEVIFDPLKNSLAGLFTDKVIEKAQNDPENYKLFVRNHEFSKDYMILFVDRAFWESH